MMTTSYFLHTRSRPDRAVIQDEWIERVILSPTRKERQMDGRIRRWARIPEMGDRALRVILSEDGETVHRRLLRSRSRGVDMHVKHFADTDTALVEFGGTPVETRELDENLYVDIDADGHIVSLTIEHAQRSAGMEFSMSTRWVPEARVVNAAERYTEGPSGGSMRYRIALHQSEEGYSVSVPGLPGCWSQGATESEAIMNITDAIREYLAVVEDQLRGEEIREIDVAV